MEARKHQCENCDKGFSNKFELMSHKFKECKVKTCKNCNTKFHQRRDLLRHEQNRKDISCDHCYRKFCNTEHFHQHLRSIREAAVYNDVDMNRRINPPSGYEEEEGYQAIVKQKASEINDRETIKRHYKIINIEIDSAFTYFDLEKLFSNIYNQQENAFKINFGFGFILYNTVEEKFKYFYNSSNNLLFEHAITIADREDLLKIYKKVTNLDLATNYYLKKPSSQWVLAGLTNIEIYIFDMKDVPIGNPPTDLPGYIKKSKSINALTHDRRGHHTFKDNKCFFRCLALHRGAKITGLELLTNRLMTDFENHTEKSFKNGVNISHLPAIEVLFHVSVNVYSLGEDGSADIIYLSKLPYEPMHINIYRNHFSYITKFKTYAKRFQCQMCDRIFDRVDNLKYHVKTCCVEKEEIYVGGKFR